MPSVSAVTPVRTVGWTLRSAASGVAVAALGVAPWLHPSVAAAAPAGQASSCPSLSSLSLPDGWKVSYEVTQTQDADLPYAAVDTIDDADGGVGMLFRLPPAPDAKAALQQRLRRFQAGFSDPIQVRSVNPPPTPNSESSAAAMAAATDEDGPVIDYFIVATSGSLTCALEVEASRAYAETHGEALAALMQSFALVP